jgi:hypothetical protein
MSIGLKCNVEGVESNSLQTKSGELIKAMNERLKIARAHLTAKQFKALINGNLDVSAFLRSVELETPQEKLMKKYSEVHKTEEDALEESDRFPPSP